MIWIPEMHCHKKALFLISEEKLHYPFRKSFSITDTVFCCGDKARCSAFFPSVRRQGN